MLLSLLLYMFSMYMYTHVYTCMYMYTVLQTDFTPRTKLMYIHVTVIHVQHVKFYYVYTVLQNQLIHVHVHVMHCITFFHTEVIIIIASKI